MDIRKTMLSGAAVLAGGALGAVSRLLILTLTGEELKSLGARNVVLPLFPIDLVNTRYKTDTDKPFVAHNLQEFYDTYKPVFKLGLTKEKIKEKFI